MLNWFKTKSIKPLKLLLLLAIVFTVSSTTFVSAQRASRECGKQRACLDGTLLCLPLPTSLPPIDTSQTNFGAGFYKASSSCGAKRCYWLFSCECGYPLGVSVCRASLDGSSCNDKKDFENKVTKENFGGEE
jgi:hypothetical protein